MAQKDSSISRRRVLGQGLALSVVIATAASSRPGWAAGTAAPDDEAFMRMALDEASKASPPFGAIIVRNGEVVARGRNLGAANNDPTAHGEMVAIRNFLASHPAGELKGTTLYTSGEPCAMCIGAILWCGIERVVFAASIAQLSTRIGQIMITSQAIADTANFTHVKITGGVLADEAMALFDKAN